MFISMFDVQYWKSNNIWDKVFKNGPSKICGRQPLKITKGMVWLKLTILLQNFERLSSTNFTWPILEYLFPFATLEKYMKSYKSYHGLILLTSVFPRKSMTPVQKNYVQKAQPYYRAKMLVVWNRGIWRTSQLAAF